MELSEQFQSWVRWSRENLPPAGDIPKINTQDFKPPFFDDFPTVVSAAASQREEFLSFCVGHLAESRSDVATRFTALRLYSALAGLFAEDSETIRKSVGNAMGLNSIELEMGRLGIGEFGQLAEKCDREADNWMQGFYQDLSLLVGLLKIEDVPSEWRIVKWEILNSYAIKDWDRATALYHKAEGERLLDDTEFRAIRGQARYLYVFGPRLDMALDTLRCEPRLYNRDTDITVIGSAPTISMILFLSGIRRTTGVNVYTGTGENQFAGDEQATVCEATADLEMALRKRPDFGPVYRSMLARCYLVTGHFHDAAEHYQHLLNWEGVSVPELFKVLVYDRLVESHRGANRTEEAIETLTRCAAEFPHLRGIQKRLAELYADESKHELAYECLRKEVQLSPELEGELGVRLALALGAAHIASAHVEKFLEKNPSTAALIDSMLKSYWASFDRLNEQSRAEWQSGICQLYVFPLIVPESCDQFHESAVMRFTKVLELELKCRIFEQFRQVVNAKGDANKSLTANTDAPPWLKNFTRFLQGGGALDLEKMSQTLCESASSREPVGQQFCRWLRQTNPSLLSKVQLLSDICKHRGAAAHERMAAGSSEEVARWCRDVIDTLVAGKSA